MRPSPRFHTRAVNSVHFCSLSPIPQTSPVQRSLVAPVRPATFLLTAVLILLCAAAPHAWAAATPTTTTLTVTSAGSPVTSVESKTAVTLTATVKAGRTAVNSGQVNFCDASAAHCTDIHLLGTAQLTSAGTATMKFRPGIGSHTYKAVFLGTKSNAPSASSTAALAVTMTAALYPSITTIAETGGAGNYTLKATVGGAGSAGLTGTVSFLDTSNADAVLGTATLAAEMAGVNFLNYSTPQTGGHPYAIATGDFNGDGVPDLAMTDNQGSTVTVLLGNGDGTFTATAANPATGSAPYGIAVGDFNGDGNLDLAVANANSNTITVLLGDGKGNFTAAATIPARGTGPESIAVGDFDGDGNLDLALANYGSGTLTVLLGNGNGTFTPTATNPAIGNSPLSLAVGDFNRDAIQDLAVVDVSNGQVMVLLGNGDGSFQAPTAAAPLPNSTSYSLVVGDFNGDGNPDLAVANYGSFGTGQVLILLGNGNGTFTEVTPPLKGPYSPYGIALGDFNGDGIPDLAITDFPNSRAVVFLGSGNGTFTTAATNPATGSDPVGLVAGDFNGDGRADLAVANFVDNSVSVLLNESQVSTATAIGIGVMPVATGTHLVLASYPGDSNYAPSTSGTTALIANQGTPRVDVTTSANPAFYGTTVTLKATLTGTGLEPTGWVEFYDGAAPLGGGTLSAGVATYSTQALLPALYLITASYFGDGNYKGVTSSALSLTVNQGIPKIEWPPPAPITDGTNLSAVLDATAKNGSAATIPGTFTYTAAPTGGTAAAVTTATVLGPGTYTLGTAFSPTDTNDYTTATGSVQLTVHSKAQTITFPAIPATTLVAGSVTLTATASSGLPVSYTSATPTICTVSGSKVTLLAVGNCGIMATQPGNSEYYAATPVGRNFHISLATQTITFPAIPATTLVTASVTLAATASSGPPVSYTSATPAICTVSGSKVTLVALGNCGIVATQPGNSDYYPATPVGRNFHITLATQTITFPAIPATTLVTGSVTLTATASSTLPVSYTSVTLSVCTVTGSKVTLVALGNCGIVATQPGNGEYYAAPAVGRNFTVTAH